MKISVIVTTYNLSSYIEECLQSVLNQTYRPCEIIVADDCSTDNTLELAKSLVGSLVVVRQDKNRGALLNTLSGLAVATGDLVAFIDGDDTWPANKLARVVEEFASNPSVVLVTHGHRRVDSEGYPTGALDATHANISRLLREEDGVERQKMLRLSILKREGVWFGSAYSIRRSSLDLPALSHLLTEHPDAANGYLDLVLAPFVVASNPTGRITYMDDVVFDYRIHGANSASSNTIDKQMRAVVRGRSTNVITRDVLFSCGVDASILAEYRHILAEYDFLESLYLRRRLPALRGFIELVPFFARKGVLLKEFTRMILVVVLGPRLVLKYK